MTVEQVAAGFFALEIQKRSESQRRSRGCVPKEELNQSLSL